MTARRAAVARSAWDATREPRFVAVAHGKRDARQALRFVAGGAPEAPRKAIAPRRAGDTRDAP